MNIQLSEKPKGCTIIEGFPGFGLVGTIVTEFLVNHTDTKEIGQITSDKIQPVVAVHEGKTVKPITIFYNKKYNLLILHSITPGGGMEWELGDTIVQMAKECEAKRILSVEGVLAQKGESEGVHYFTGDEEMEKQLQEKGLEVLDQGIVVGVTAALIARSDYNLVSLFAETQSQLPDARAAAEVIKVLDKVLDLEVDPEPLMKQAEEFEEKLKKLMQQGQQASQEQQRKRLNYLG